MTIINVSTTVIFDSYADRKRNELRSNKLISTDVLNFLSGLSSNVVKHASMTDLQLTAWLLVLPAFDHCFAMFENLHYQATSHSAICCQCATPTFSIAFFTCKARKLHQYFIGGSILSCTDSMGKEINSQVLIMQCGDTDLILCLSTCTDILMHSAPLLSSTQEVFHSLFKAWKKRHFLFDRGYITASTTKRY